MPSRDLVSGTIWSLAGRLVMVGSMFLITMLLARLLSREDFGIFLICFSIVSLGGLLVPMGGNLVAVRLIVGAIVAGRDHEVWPLINTILLTVLGGGALFVLVLGGLLGPAVTAVVTDGRNLPWLVPATTAWAAGYGLQLVTAELFRAGGNIREASLGGGAFSHAILACGLAGIGFAAWCPDVSGLLAAQAAVVWITCVFLLRRLRQTFQNFPRSGSLRQPVQFVCESLPGAGIQVLLLLVTQIDVWAVGILCGPEDVAQYGAAVRLVLLMGIPGLVLEGGWAPLVAKLLMSGEIARLQRLASTMAALATLMAAVLFGVFLLAGGWVTTLVYGPDYQPSGTYLRVLVLGYAAYPLFFPASLLLILAGRQRLMLGILIGVAVMLTAGAGLTAWAGSLAGVAAVTGAAVWGLHIALVWAAWSATGVWCLATPAAGLRFWREGRQWLASGKAASDGDVPH